MTGNAQVPDGDRDVETVDLDAVESRRQVMLATADMAAALGRNAAIRNRLILEMGKAAGRSANDVPALVAEVRQLRVALASQTAQSEARPAAALLAGAAVIGGDVTTARKVIEAATPWLAPAQSGAGVAEAVEKAWDEGYNAGDPFHRRGNPAWSDNPYRAARIARTTTEEANHG